MKDLNNVIVLIITAFVGVVAVLVMLFVPSFNSVSFDRDLPSVPDLPDSSGFAVHPVYGVGYALPFAYSSSSVNSFLQFSDVSSSISRSFDVSDTVIYNRGFVSYDGQQWQPFTITTTNAVSGAWIYTKGTASVSFTPAQLRMSLSRNISNNTYVVVYSCTRNVASSSWDCHDGWQIIKFDARISTSTVTPTCNTCSGLGYNCGSWSDGCGGTLSCGSCSGSCVSGKCSTFSGTIYYVSTSGNDGNTGLSTSAAFRTLASACSKAKSGSLIHVNAGTYTESSQCVLAPEVSIEGDGEGVSIIKSHYTSGYIIYMSSSSATNGNNKISRLTLDGDSLTGYAAIYNHYRHNVVIDHVIIKDFLNGGIWFEGYPGTGQNEPSTYITGGKITNCVITNSNRDLNSGGQGSIRSECQSDMEIYNCTISQVNRGAGDTGQNVLVGDNNRRLKLHGCTIYTPTIAQAGGKWNFITEFWNPNGGMEIYDNKFYGAGSIDISGYLIRKRLETYGASIHDNEFIAPALQPYDPHQFLGICIESFGDINDVLIYNNHFKNVATPIQLTTLSDSSYTQSINNVDINNNIMENVGYSDDAANAIEVITETTPDYYKNINIESNTITASNGYYGIYWKVVGADSNIFIKSNTIKNFDSGAIIFTNKGGSLDTVTITNNIFSNNGATISMGLTPKNYINTPNN